MTQETPPTAGKTLCMNLGCISVFISPFFRPWNLPLQPGSFFALAPSLFLALPFLPSFPSAAAATWSARGRTENDTDGSPSTARRWRAIRCRRPSPPPAFGSVEAPPELRALGVPTMRRRTGTLEEGSQWDRPMTRRLLRFARCGKPARDCAGAYASFFSPPPSPFLEGPVGQPRQLRRGPRPVRFSGSFPFPCTTRPRDRNRPGVS